MKLQVIIILLLLLGCSVPYKSDGLVIEVTKDGYFVDKDKVDDIEAFLTHISDPEEIKLYLFAENDVSARNVLRVLDLAKDLGFKEVSVVTPRIE